MNDAISNGWYENANNYITKFENSFKRYVNRKYSISVQNCTAALHLSLMALGIKKNDEVIVPDVTWIASVAPIIYLGAKPVFADIDPKTWCLSTESVKSLISKKTKAIVAVNLYGNMADFDSLIKLGIPIIEDAAESIGSKYKNILSGKFGVTSCFSFHGSKTLVTGEGGMLVTDDKNIYQKCLILRDHGRRPNDLLFQNFTIGYKYKMSNLQAALGLAQLERIKILIKKKRQIFKWYNNIFKNNSLISLNPEISSVYNSYWMTTIVIINKNLNKFKIIDHLKRKILLHVHFFPFKFFTCF